jgi:ubiquinone/menaquinone biosynthesis C-methylase UbiE
MRAAYDTASAVWGAGPQAVYDRLAAAIVAAAPVPLGGRLVLDVGAGTGAVSRAVTAAGGKPVAVDAAWGMSRATRRNGVRSACGDALALPFRSASFWTAVAAFLLSHLRDPVAGLAEAKRVVEPGGAVVVGGFGTGPEHPVKSVVDEAAQRHGWIPPAWYVRLKTETEAAVAQADQVSAAARSAGLGEVQASEHPVEVGPLTPEDLVGYRLGMPSLAAFVAGLRPKARQALVQDALAALGPEPPPLSPWVLVMRARVP